MNRILVAAVVALSICVAVLAYLVTRGPAATPPPAPVAESKPFVPVPIPAPDLGRLEPAVAAQLKTAQDALAAIQKNPGAGAAERFKAYGDLGRLYHAYEIWDAAQACYRNAIALVPAAFETQYLLAYSLQQAGRIDEALAAYNDALRLQPDYAATRLRMVEVLRLLDRPQQAREQLEAVLQASPDIAAAVVMRGELALADKDYTVAIALLEKALAANPKADRLHYLLAQAYRDSGQDDKAREHLSHSGTVGVRIPDPLVEELEQLARGERVAVLQGRLAYGAGDYKGAIGYFRRALEEAPDSVGARVNLGASLVQVGDVDGAINEFREVLAQEPGNVSANFNLAGLLLKRGDHAGAARHYSPVVDAQPQDAQAWLGMARALRGSGKPIESYRHYLQVTRLAPQFADGWIELVELLLDNKRHGEAADVLRQAHAKLPDNGPIAHSYARFLAAVPDTGLRNGTLALELAQRVFKAKPTLLHGETLAMAYAQAGQCNMAVQVQQKIVDEMKSRSAAAGQIEAAGRILDHYKSAQPCAPGA